MHSTMQRIIGALRARVESRFPRFRNRFKNVRATVFFSFSLSHRVLAYFLTVQFWSDVWYRMAACYCEESSSIYIWPFYRAEGHGIPNDAVPSSPPRLDRESEDRFSLISPSPRNGSKRFGKSIVFSPIGSNVGSYIRHGYKSNLTRMIRFMGFEYGMAERGGFVIRSWLVQRFEVRLWGNDDFVSTLDPCIFRF